MPASFYTYMMRFFSMVLFSSTNQYVLNVCSHVVAEETGGELDLEGIDEEELDRVRDFIILCFCASVISRMSNEVLQFAKRCVSC
jgi:hypothetical protein